MNSFNLNLENLVHDGTTSGHSSRETVKARPLTLRLAEFVKFSHTLFVLPFALISMLVAGNGRVQWAVFGWILLCMVAARTAAMVFNRLVDWEIDKQNPRTAHRHLLIEQRHGWTLFGTALLGFIFGTWNLNRCCFFLSPLLITVLLGYSLSKRFTAYSHFFLGLALALAPIAAWAAVTDELRSSTPYLLAGSVLCWVFGFDVIYATMDIDFDRANGLHSIPAMLGLPASLRLARFLHGLAAAGFCLFGWWAHLGWPFALACILVVPVLFWEHRVADPKIPASLNRAFFQANAAVSLALLLGVGMSYLLHAV